MKLALAVCVVVLAVAGAHAQDYYYGADPAPSMYAQQIGQQNAPFVNEQGQAIPAAPSMDAIMAQGGAPYVGNQQMINSFEQSQAAFVEQAQPQYAAPGAAGPYYATEEAPQASEEEEVAADTEVEAEAEETESEESAEGEAEEAVEAEGEDARFLQRKGVKKAAKKVGKAIKKGAKKVGRGLKKVGKAIKNGVKKVGKAIKKGLKKLFGKKKGGAKPNTFKPLAGKPKNDARSPSAKTPKAAGGRKLPPMPAPLPAQFKIDCKKNPAHCIDAETPAEGEAPGDHSPKAVFKKKMEVIKKSLMINNRNIAQESKWIDQVELIMKQYNIKVKKVKEHIGDERKAIKELLRQRRIILNEKKQKELELKLKLATTELSALTDALNQVQKKEKELGSGKGQLGAKIKLLVGDLKKLKTDKSADEKQALKKAD